MKKWLFGGRVSEKQNGFYKSQRFLKSEWNWPESPRARRRGCQTCQLFLPFAASTLGIAIFEYGASTNIATQRDASQMALDRTWLAHERTLMAWVRTATSMIGFGFTIYKFFQFEEGRRVPAAFGFLTPRDFALVMVSIGVVTLVVATISHRQETRMFHLEGRRSMAEVIAALVSAFGLAVLVSAALNR